MSTKFRPLDFDPKTAVTEIEEINWSEWSHGFCRRRHLGHIEISRHHGYVVILVAWQARICRAPNDARYRPVWKPYGWQRPKFTLTRWRKYGGLWRLQNHFHMSENVLEAMGRAMDLRVKVNQFLLEETPDEATKAEEILGAGLGGPPTKPQKFCSYPEFRQAFETGEDNCFDPLTEGTIETPTADLIFVGEEDLD